jgi:hypothetical protein
VSAKEVEPDIGLIESRKFQRRRTLKVGKIILNNRCSVIDCKVRDQSLMGAKLDVETCAQLPTIFELQMLPERRTWPARLVWQKGNKAGVIFSLDLQ